jgi:hypothetical protein
VKYRHSTHTLPGDFTLLAAKRQVTPAFCNS